MALAADRRRKEAEEKQNQCQPSSVPSAEPQTVPSTKAPENGTMEWGTAQSGAVPYASQSTATPYAQANEWMPQQQQWQQGSGGGWQQEGYQQPQQQGSCQWQQQQQQQANWGYPQQQQDAYGNYQDQNAYGNYQHGGDCYQDMSSYGWQQDWQQNSDGSFYNAHTPSWESSMTPEELRIQRTVAGMSRPGTYNM